MYNGEEFWEGTKLLRIMLSPLDTMGIAAFNCFKQVLLHTRASTQEGVTMGSGSCPGDQIFLPGWVFECALLPYTAREWRWFLECTWNSFFLFMVSLQPGILEGQEWRRLWIKWLSCLRGQEEIRSNFCLSVGLYFLQMQWEAAQHGVSRWALDIAGSASH